MNLSVMNPVKSFLPSKQQESYNVASAVFGRLEIRLSKTKLLLFASISFQKLLVLASKQIAFCNGVLG